MISGMNSEMEYQGKIYHVQTEDGGRNNPVITTQLFFKGAIVVTQKTNYADIIKAEYLESIVKDLMKQQHSLMIKELLSGKLLGGKTAAAKPDAKPASSEQSRAIPPSRERGKKSLDDLILDYLVSKKDKEGS